MAWDRVEMGEPGTGKADSIDFTGRVEDPERKSPHNTPVAPATFVPFVHDQCRMVRQDPGFDQIEKR
jgi:hypothetical protein